MLNLNHNNEQEQGFIFFTSIIIIITWIIFNYRFFIDYYGFHPDDLFIKNYRDSTLFEIILSSRYEFRPVSRTLRWVIANICGTNMLLWMIIQSVLNIGSCILFFYILMNLLRNATIYRRVIISGFSTLLFIICPFYWYQITELQGLMELCGTVFSILFMYFIQKYIKESKGLCYAIIMYVFAVLSHERYMALMVPFVVAVFFKEKKIQRIKVLLPIGITIVYWLLRKIFLDHAYIVQGNTSFSLSKAIRLFIRGTATLLGFNWEKDYFVGIAMRSMAKPILIINVISVIVLITMVIKYFFDKSSDKLMLFTYITAIISLCAVCSIGTRVELRWLYVPYAFILMMVSQILSFKDNLIKAFTLFLACTIIVSLYQTSFYKKYYCYYTNRYGSELYKSIDDLVEDDNVSIAIIGNRNAWNKLYVYDFFEQVIDDNFIRVDIYSSMYQFLLERNPSYYTRVLLEDRTNDTYVDVTDSVE